VSITLSQKSARFYSVLHKMRTQPTSYSAMFTHEKTKSFRTMYGMTCHKHLV